MAQLSVYHSLVLVYKILSTKSPQYLHEKLSGKPEERYYQTRFIENENRKHNLVLDSESSAEGDLALSSFKYRASRQWNNLPLDVREATDVNQFKLQLRQWVLNNISVK